MRTIRKQFANSNWRDEKCTKQIKNMCIKSKQKFLRAREKNPTATTHTLTTSA